MGLWEDIAPKWVKDLGNYSGFLIKFAKNPVAFILGTVLTVILGGIEAIVRSVVEGIWVLFVGSDPSSTDGTVGLIDIPILAADYVVSSGEFIGSPIVSWVETMSSGAVDFALEFGYLAPLVITVEAAVVILLIYLTVRTLLRVAVDVIPGGGGLLS